MTEIDDEPVEVPIDGVLDLHTFAPEDVPSLVEEYIRVCQEKGILDVRIIHGKGKWVLRRTVHARLERDPVSWNSDSILGRRGGGLPWCG